MENRSWPGRDKESKRGKTLVIWNIAFYLFWKVQIGLIQNKIVLPTDAPIHDQVQIVIDNTVQ